MGGFGSSCVGVGRGADVAAAARSTASRPSHTGLAARLWASPTSVSAVALPRLGLCAQPRAHSTAASCNYDAAGISLTAMYGPMKPAGTAVSANLKTFDQTLYVPGGNAAGISLGNGGGSAGRAHPNVILC